MSSAIAPGQRCIVKVDGRRLSGYIRSIGEFRDSVALVRLDAGELIESSWRLLGREAR